MPMRLALYHPWVYLYGGAERVITELLERSRHDWTLYTHHYAPEGTFSALQGHVVELGPPVSVRRSFRPLLHAAATMAAARLPQDGARALLVSSEGLGDLLLTRSTLPTVAYCHTPLKILHDPAARAVLAERDPAKASLLRVLGRPFQVVDAALWRRYRYVLANSLETRRRVIDGGLAEPDRVEVLHPGVDTSRFGRGYELLSDVPATAEREPVFLVAGRIMWQKNIMLAIDAFRLAVDRGMQARLIIAGMVDEKSRDHLADLRKAAEGLPITFEICPDDARLAQLYELATALLFTAPNEDWGIVPLESMASGTPVIAVNAGGPRESIVHGETGWLLPGTARAFANQMQAVRAMPGELVRMRRACRLWASRYDWDSFVARVDDIMEQVVHEGRVVRPRSGAPTATVTATPTAPAPSPPPDRTATPLA
jgi:glycosyltransferase involved in cell wall biosynthesis